MGSPNEPGQPGLGERPVSSDVSTDVPPWQNSGRPRTEAVIQPSTTQASATRWVTGTAAPSTPSATLATQRTDVVEAIPSELPDLSSPVPRPAQQRSRHSADSERSDALGRAASSPRVEVTGRPRGPVRASMQIRRIDPWSALKVSLLLNVALFFVWMIAVAFLYLVLGAMGVWSKLNSNVGDLLTNSGGGGGDLVSAASIFGGAALIGLVNIVLLTAMATVGAYIYNLST
ncbi:MAG: DUF3566 domain-containing protein, partial [Mycobacterium sp.]|nr:DUF3566 domain-containing protein [Mycobacterium sp.]